MSANTKKVITILLIVIITAFTACTGNKDNIQDNDQVVETEGNQGENIPPTDKEPEEIVEDEPEPEQEVSQTLGLDELKDLKVNELGKIMVIMYHGIGENEEEWVRTPENFRKDLKTLYDNGYRAIGMKDYIEGNIDTPPGTTPVILTFDDGLQNQFNILDDGGDFEVDPDSAVGILEEFNEQYPDFGLKATFYVFYPVPFRQEELIAKKFEYLVEKGMEIGNHAYTHENLRADMNTKEPRDAQFVQEALGKNVQLTQEILPGYEVDSLALPYGAAPQDEDVFNYVVKGSFEGTEYHHKVVLLVGSNPARSPYHIETNMARLPRVRGSEMNTEGTGIYDWLDYFDKNPEERFISDGDPNTISFPKELEEYMDPERAGGRTIQAYE